MTAVLPLVPFPPLHWWFLATQCHGGEFAYEPPTKFAKQTLRNRMILSGPHGLTHLTFPIQKQLNNTELSPLLSPHFRPVHSFRTLQSVYGGAPFFEHFEEDLRALWHAFLPASDEHPKPLSVFNLATIEWVAQQCNWELRPSNLTPPAFAHSPIDLRSKSALAGEEWAFERYTQLFEAKNGFIPGCSILDALMTLGPTAVRQQIQFLTHPASNSK